MMDSLPVELVRLVFDHCDLASVKNLRLMSGLFAEIGYEYLISPAFNVLGWRDDLARLQAIANHDQLRGSIESITINFADVDEYNARHASFFQHWLEDPEERNERLATAWVQYYDADRRRKALPAFDSRPDLLLGALARLPNLTDLEVTFTKCPFDIDVLDQVFRGLPSCRKMDRAQAIRNLSLIASALKETHLSSFAVDRFPLEVFKMQDERRHWVDCASGPFAHLAALHVTIDPPSNILPAARFRAIKGLGSLLRTAPNVTHLSLGFHTYGAPKHKFMLFFDTLLEDFTFEKLTDLKLEGISCDEADLRRFLLRHAATLERLRLGGRGLAKTFEVGLGGIYLGRGTFRSLFMGLRNRMPKLERLHMEGDFECVGVEGSSHEAYMFHGVTDDDWHDVKDAHAQGLHSSRKTRDCLDFERFLLHGGKYPDLRVAAGPGVAPAQ